MKYLTPGGRNLQLKIMRYSKLPIFTFLVLALLLPAHAFAKQKLLWNGLVRFQVPAKSQVIAQGDDIDGWDAAFMVVPKKQKKNRVAALIVRQTLEPEEANLTTKQLSELLKQDFVEDGDEVSNWKFNKRKQQVTANILAVADVPWSAKEVEAVGEFRVIRVYKNEVVGVIALGDPSHYGKKAARPFRQIVSTFETPKPRPNKNLKRR